MLFRVINAFKSDVRSLGVYYKCAPELKFPVVQRSVDYSDDSSYLELESINSGVTLADLAARIPVRPPRYKLYISRSIAVKVSQWFHRRHSARLCSESS